MVKILESIAERAERKRKERIDPLLFLAGVKVYQETRDNWEAMVEAANRMFRGEKKTSLDSYN